eukprot:scaffold34129_cov32-Tisochrysis_lutea.AAC.11
MRCGGAHRRTLRPPICLGRLLFGLPRPGEIWLRRSAFRLRLIALTTVALCGALCGCKPGASSGMGGRRVSQLDLDRPLSLQRQLEPDEGVLFVPPL